MREDDEDIGIVDENDHVISKSTRKKVHASGQGRHRVACVLVFNANGELLLQKRSATVNMYPNCWTVSSAGHVGYGDTYIATAVRELNEEVGIEVTQGDLKLIGKLNIPLPGDDEMWQVYKYVTDQETFSVQRDEVSATKFVSLETLKRMVEDPQGNICERARRLFKHFLFT